MCCLHNAMHTHVILLCILLLHLRVIVHIAEDWGILCKWLLEAACARITVTGSRISIICITSCFACSVPAFTTCAKLQPHHACSDILSLRRA